MAQYSVDIVAKALGGAQVDKLADSFRGVDRAAAQAQKGADGATNGIRALRPAAGAAATGMQGLGAAIQAALGPILAVSTALAVLKKGIDTAFERGAAEQKLRNFTDSAGEYSAALALAADSSRKFGISQTEATTALGDVYSRLKGLGFGLKETGEIYQGFNAIALQAGTSTDDASRAFLQLSQALGSGKLQGDELRSVLETMPQLGQAIAQSMGVSAAQLRQLGQEGKISGEVIYKALSEAAAASGELGNKLNAQQSVMKNLEQVSDQLLNSIGQAFGPAVIKGAELLAEWGQKLADWYGYVGDVIFPQIVKAVQPLQKALADAFDGIDIDVVVNFLQNILIKGFELATWHIGNMSKALAFVINGFKQLADNFIVKGLLNTMGAIVEKLGLTGSKVGEWKQKQDEVTTAAAASVNQYSSLPPMVDDAKAAAKELKQEQEAVTAAIQASVQAADALAQAQSTKVDQGLQIAQARLQAETAINNVLLEQAQRQLEGAANATQREAAARRIYQLTVNNAANELRATRLQIQAEIQKAQIQLQSAQVKAKEIQATVALAMAQGTVTKAHFEALAAQREAVDLAQTALQVAIEVGNEHSRAAQAVYQGKVAAAGAAYEQNRVFQATQGAASAARQFAGNMQSAASAAASAASSMQQAAHAGGAASGGSLGLGSAMNNRYFAKRFYEAQKQFGDEYRGMSNQLVRERLGSFAKQWMDAAESINRAMAQETMRTAKEQLRNLGNRARMGSGGSGGMGVRAFAEGGYVNGPTPAIVGEGGESEYIIPSSKMDQALANYAAGKRGNSVLTSAPPVNLNYSGPIMRTPSGDYVKAGDVPGIISQAVKKTIGTLHSSPRSRSAAGIQ